MRISSAVAVALVLAQAMHAADSSTASSPSSELPANLRHLAGLAASLPPEFQADALLNIVESARGLDPQRKKKLIEDAFAAARQARNPYAQAAVHGINPDSRQAFSAGAQALNLDRLSLEMRAVRAMLSFDPLAAKPLFVEVQKPALPAAAGSCADALIPRLDAYYETAAPVIDRGFTAQEAARQEPLALLLQILSGVGASEEIAPAARMILSATLTPRQFEAALSAFTTRLDSISPGGRAFGETGAAVQEEIGALASRAASLGVPRTGLATAYRRSLTSNFSRGGCSDSASVRVAGPVDWFNLSELRGGLPMIDAGEVTAKASSAGGEMKLDAFWTSPSSEKILASARNLRTARNGTILSLEERSTNDWRQKLDDFLEQMNDWKPSDPESELDFFNEKAVVYQSLIDLCPAGAKRQALAGAFVDFLKSSDAQAQNPVDWFWHAQNLYHRLAQAGDRDAEMVMKAYQASGNLMLEVYAQWNGR